LEDRISSIYRAEGISDITRQQTQNQFPTTNGRVVNVSQSVLSLTLHKGIYTEPAAIITLYNEVNLVSAGQITEATDTKIENKYVFVKKKSDYKISIEFA